MPGDPLKQNPTSGSLTLTSVRTVVAGDSLASIAYREYGDPGMWRPLALFNGIDDPLRLRLGSSVLLPVVDDLWPGCDVAEAQVSNAFTVTVDGKPMPADLVPLLVPRTSTTASTCPTW